MASFTEERIEHAKQIIKKITLPSQPKVVMEVNKEMHQSDPDFQKIANLVSQDTSMSARVINVINAPFFGLSRKVESIIQALTLMGLDNFFKVILTTCLQEKMSGSSKEHQNFWKHSMRVALAAEKIAKSLRSYLLAEDITPDLAYMTGLFHDSAIPILLQKKPEYLDFTPYALSHKLDIIEDEDRFVGSDHCMIGGLLARTWSLPPAVIKTIIYHHSSNPAAEKDAPVKLISVIKLADYIGYSFDYTSGDADVIIDTEWDMEDWGEKNSIVLDELNITLDEVADLKEEIFEILTHTQ